MQGLFITVILVSLASVLASPGDAGGCPSGGGAPPLNSWTNHDLVAWPLPSKTGITCSSLFWGLEVVGRTAPASVAPYGFPKCYQNCLDCYRVYGQQPFGILLVSSLEWSYYGSPTGPNSWTHCNFKSPGAPEPRDQPEPAGPYPVNLESLPNIPGSPSEPIFAIVHEFPDEIPNSVMGYVVVGTLTSDSSTNGLDMGAFAILDLHDYVSYQNGNLSSILPLLVYDEASDTVAVPESSSPSSIGILGPSSRVVWEQHEEDTVTGYNYDGRQYGYVMFATPLYQYSDCSNDTGAPDSWEMIQLNATHDNPFLSRLTRFSSFLTPESPVEHVSDSGWKFTLLSDWAQIANNKLVLVFQSGAFYSPEEYSHKISLDLQKQFWEVRVNGTLILGTSHPSTVSLTAFTTFTFTQSENGLFTLSIVKDTGFYPILRYWDRGIIMTTPFLSVESGAVVFLTQFKATTVDVSFANSNLYYEYSSADYYESDILYTDHSPTALMDIPTLDHSSSGLAISGLFKCPSCAGGYPYATIKITNSAGSTICTAELSSFVGDTQTTVWTPFTYVCPFSATTNGMRISLYGTEVADTLWKDILVSYENRQAAHTDACSPSTCRNTFESGYVFPWCASYCRNVYPDPIGVFYPDRFLQSSNFSIEIPIPGDLVGDGQQKMLIKYESTTAPEITFSQIRQNYESAPTTFTNNIAIDAETLAVNLNFSLQADISWLGIYFSYSDDTGNPQCAFATTGSDCNGCGLCLTINEVPSADGSSFLTLPAGDHLPIDYCAFKYTSPLNFVSVLDTDQDEQRSFAIDSSCEFSVYVSGQGFLSVASTVKFNAGAGKNIPFFAGTGWGRPEYGNISYIAPEISTEDANTQNQGSLGLFVSNIGPYKKYGYSITLINQNTTLSQEISETNCEASGENCAPTQISIYTMNTVPVPGSYSFKLRVAGQDSLPFNVEYDQIVFDLTPIDTVDEVIVTSSSSISSLYYTDLQYNSNWRVCTSFDVSCVFPQQVTPDFTGSPSIKVDISNWYGTGVLYSILAPDEIIDVQLLPLIFNITNPFCAIDYSNSVQLPANCSWANGQIGIFGSGFGGDSRGIELLEIIAPDGTIQSTIPLNSTNREKTYIRFEIDSYPFPVHISLDNLGYVGKNLIFPPSFSPYVLPGTLNCPFCLSNNLTLSPRAAVATTDSFGTIYFNVSHSIGPDELEIRVGPVEDGQLIEESFREERYFTCSSVTVEYVDPCMISCSIPYVYSVNNQIGLYMKNFYISTELSEDTLSVVAPTIATGSLQILGSNHSISTAAAGSVHLSSLDPRPRVYFEGTGFGFDITRARVLYKNPDGFSGVCEVEAVNDTSCTCRVAYSSGTGYKFQIFNGNQPSLFSNDTFDYPPIPKIIALNSTGLLITEEFYELDFGNVTGISGVRTSGGDPFTVTYSKEPGDRFSSLTIGGEAVYAQQETTDDCTTCVLSAQAIPGIGIGMQVVVKITDSNSYIIPSLAAPVFSYAGPSVDAIVTDNCTVQGTQLYDCSFDSDVILEISGDNFGDDGIEFFYGIQHVAAVHTPGIRHTSITVTIPAYTAYGEDISIYLLQARGEYASSGWTIGFVQCGPTSFFNVTSKLCEACDMGSYGLNGMCDSCPPRATTLNGTSLVGCIDCTTGEKHILDETNDYCSPCPPGTYTDTDANECELCVPGKWSNTTGGATACTDADPGYYVPTSGSSTQTLCPGGSFSVGRGSSECTLAPAGQYKSEADSSPKQCAAGKYSYEGQSACTLCSNGTFVSTEGAASCDPCVAGKYQPLDGQSKCDACPNGKWSDAGASSCSVCPVGKYRNGVGGDGCLSCPSGKYANTTGTIECTGCAAGKYSEHDELYGSILCSNCPAGKYGIAGYCEECDVGWVASGEGLEACTECPAGEKEDGSRLSCIKCGDGWDSIREARDSLEWPRNDCDECKAGTNRSSLADSIQRCTECIPGYYQPSKGQASCLPCPVGTEWQSKEECVPCLPGYYQDVEGQPACKECPAGTFASGHGSVTCDPCKGRVFHEAIAQAECVRCPDQTYYVEELQPGGSRLLTCKPCPEGIDCTYLYAGNASTLPIEGILLATSGYWLDYNNESQEVVAHVCPPGACLAAAECENSTISGEDYASTMALTGTASCCGTNRKPASINPLCAECLPGFYEWGGKCLDCPESSVPIIFLFILASWAYVFLFHFISQETTAETKILVYFLQTALLFFGPASEWLIILKYLNLDFLDIATDGTTNEESGQCFGRLSGTDQLMLTAFVPILCLAQLGMNLLVAFGFHVCMHKRYTPWYDNVKFSFTPYIRTFFGLLIFSYTSTVSTTLKYFDCVEITPNISVVADYPSVHCKVSDANSHLDQSYEEYRSIKGLMIFFYVFIFLFPMVGVSWLFYADRKGLFNDSKFKPRYGILFEIYQRKYYYWEMVILLRRSILSALVVYFQDRQTQMTAASLANLFFLCLQFVLRPFDLDVDNFCETCSLALLTLQTIKLTTTYVGVDGLYRIGDVIFFFFLIIIPGTLYLLWIAKLKWDEFMHGDEQEAIMNLQASVQLQKMVDSKAALFDKDMFDGNFDGGAVHLSTQGNQGDSDPLAQKEVEITEIEEPAF